MSGRGGSGLMRRPLPQGHYVGSKKRPDDSNDLGSLDGGVMGEGGCPSRVEVIAWRHRLSPHDALTVKEYIGSRPESQENTLRNQIIILLFQLLIDMIVNQKDLWISARLKSRKTSMAPGAAPDAKNRPQVLRKFSFCELLLWRNSRYNEGPEAIQFILAKSSFSELKGFFSGGPESGR
jgi:hypothetical protein